MHQKCSGKQLVMISVGLFVESDTTPTSLFTTNDKKIGFFKFPYILAWLGLHGNASYQTNNIHD